MFLAFLHDLSPAREGGVGRLSVSSTPPFRAGLLLFTSACGVILAQPLSRPAHPAPKHDRRYL